MDAISRDKAVLSILQDQDLEKSRLWLVLKNTAILPTTHGALKKVTELYVPDASLRDLLEGDDCFPAEGYTSHREVRLRY